MRQHRAKSAAVFQHLYVVKYLDCPRFQKVLKPILSLILLCSQAHRNNHGVCNVPLHQKYFSISNVLQHLVELSICCVLRHLKYASIIRALKYLDYPSVCRVLNTWSISVSLCSPVSAPCKCLPSQKSTIFHHLLGSPRPEVYHCVYGSKTPGL